MVPVFNHEGAIAATVAALKGFGLKCYLVDDGSAPACAAVLREIAASEERWVRLIRLAENQGKGPAVMAGCMQARRDGHTHAVQVDADGQHDVSDLPRLLELARRNPAALVTGIPIYDASVPRSRLYGRYVTHVWVWINTLSLEIRDSMCGFRVYPLAPTLMIWQNSRVSHRMAFDTDILVRLWWHGVPVLQQPTHVTYPRDGVSHFNLLWDNVRISGMHARLFLGMLLRLPWLLGRLVARHVGQRRAVAL